MFKGNNPQPMLIFDTVIEGLPNLETIRSELGDDATVWTVADETNEAILIVPDKSGEHIIWIFLKESDAEHLAYILKQINPQFKNVHLAAKAATVGIILDYSRDEQQPVALITPAKALDFFEEYEEFLSHYYQ
jgi:hypothetical protein